MGCGQNKESKVGSPQNMKNDNSKKESTKFNKN